MNEMQRSGRRCEAKADEFSLRATVEPEAVAKAALIEMSEQWRGLARWAEQQDVFSRRHDI